MHCYIIRLIPFSNQNMTCSLIIPCHLLRISELWICDHSVTEKKRRNQNTCRLIQSHRKTTIACTRWFTSMLDCRKMACSQCKATAGGLTRTTMALHDHITLPSCTCMALLAYLSRFSAYCLAMPKTLQYQTIPQSAYHIIIFPLQETVNFVF
jgi:hypothetical protein